MDELEEWDEIERRLGGIYAEDDMAGNTKQHPPWVTTLVVSLVVATFTVVSNWWFGDGRQIARVDERTQLMQKQLELLASRPYISRDEFERELSRLDRRLDWLERDSQSGKQREVAGDGKGR